MQSDVVEQTYRPQRAVQSDTVELRGLTCQVWRWPGTDPVPVVLLHGFLDTGETFQFLVDELPHGWNILAPDLRGFGRSGWSGRDYWFPEYLADLDRLLDIVSPDAAVDLIGHSMGGNIAGLYAGVRPERVRKLVLLEGFGLPRTAPDMAPARYREWLDQLTREQGFLSYPDWDAFTHVLVRRNPRLPRDRAAFVARAWGREAVDGSIVIRADPAHKRVNPVLYRREETEACWRAITAPAQWIVAEQSEILDRLKGDIAESRLHELFRRIEIVRIPDAGHMLHFERPDAVAAAVSTFLGRNALPDS
jgi:pimeloyl-ACP methyl ester carboxylesterase